MIKSARDSNFGAGVKVASARKCADSTADTNGDNFRNTKNVQGLFHLFVDKGLHFLAVQTRVLN